MVDDEEPMREFCQAFLERRPEDIQKQLNVILNRIISILDTKAPDDKKENLIVKKQCCESAASVRINTGVS